MKTDEGTPPHKMIKAQLLEEVLGLRDMCQRHQEQRIQDNATIQHLEDRVRSLVEEGSQDKRIVRDQKLVIQKERSVRKDLEDAVGRAAMRIIRGRPEDALLILGQHLPSYITTDPWEGLDQRVKEEIDSLCGEYVRPEDVDTVLGIVLRILGRGK